MARPGPGRAAKPLPKITPASQHQREIFRAGQPTRLTATAVLPNVQLLSAMSHWQPYVVLFKQVYEGNHNLLWLLPIVHAVTVSACSTATIQRR